ncbi:MAG: thioredoxin-like domain-containing protein [Phocaeicola sp.]|uniref:thioredoxin-like domain-containing protein n=1 Tax=Phocaeicola sp. TaxID=2773926 RepID=UPI003F9FA0E6
MKNISFLFISFLILLSSCGKKNTFILEGKLDDLTSDSLVLYYIEPVYKLDTLILKKGVFKQKFNADSISLFYIILDNQEKIPVIVESGGKIQIKGNNRLYVIKGKGENKLMGETLLTLKKREVMNLPMKAQVDTFIKNNPRSYANVFLIDRFYAHDSTPDYKHIIELIQSLNGNVQDTRYLTDLLAKAKEQKGDENKYINLFNEPDKDGKTIDFRDLKNKYVLVSFWASWDAKSMEEQDSIATIVKQMKKEPFTAISVSLDMDKDAWTEIISKRDTTQWKQVCGFKGWKGNIARQIGLNKLPTNILVAKDKSIIDNDISSQTILNRIRNLIKQDKEKEKSK